MRGSGCLGGTGRGLDGQRWSGRRRAGPAVCQAVGGAAGARKARPRAFAPRQEHHQRLVPQSLLTLRGQPAHCDHCHLEEETGTPFVTGQHFVSGKAGSRAQWPSSRGVLAGAEVKPGSPSQSPRTPSPSPPFRLPRPHPLEEANRGSRHSNSDLSPGGFPGGSTQQALGQSCPSPRRPPKCQTLINLTARGPLKLLPSPPSVSFV